MSTAEPARARRVVVVGGRRRLRVAELLFERGPQLPLRRRSPRGASGRMAPAALDRYGAPPPAAPAPPEPRPPAVGPATRPQFDPSPAAPPPAAPPAAAPLREALASLDPDAMSPREALEALYRLRGLIGER